MAIDKTDRLLLTYVALVVAGMYGVALVLSWSSLGWGNVIGSYTIGSSATAFFSTSIAAMFFAFESIYLKAAPVPHIRKRMSAPAAWLWVGTAAFIAPVFMASFTVMKTLIGMKLGFTWDAAFADLDAAIFGIDPWRITHAVFGGALTKILEFFYATWGIALVMSLPIVAWANREYTASFVLAMFMTWAVTGLAFAAIFASAGPCFAFLFDPELGVRFAPLIERLNGLPNSSIAKTQAYLASTWNPLVAAKGGGISAFPSVHVAVAVLYVAAAWRRPVLRWILVAYAVIIWIGSIHFGYHYAIDGIASAFIAVGCWHASRRIVGVIAARQCRLPPYAVSQPAA